MLNSDLLGHAWLAAAFRGCPIEYARRRGGGWGVVEFCVLILLKTFICDLIVD